MPQIAYHSPYTRERKQTITQSLKLGTCVEQMVSIQLNTKQRIDGLQLLSLLPDAYVRISFFDPQYRGVLEKNL